MRVWTALLVVVLPACGFRGAGQPGDDIAGDDDTAPPDASLCFGSYARACLTALPTQAFVISDADVEIDTDHDASCDPNVAPFCAIAGTSITVTGDRTLRAFGSRPLVLISTGDTPADIAGLVDVSSKVIGDHAAGAGAAAAALCTGATAPLATAGGAGGSFGGKGGDGSPGFNEANNPQGRAAEAAAFPGQLRGGCAGADGSAIVTPGHGGAGGGAIAIIAASIAVTGTVNASGAGGSATGAVKAGGGGGGSGGMIILDAVTITTGANTRIFANGGGGGQGGATGLGKEGQRGDDPSRPDDPADGGDGGTTGGHGGDGSFGNASPNGDQGGAANNSGGGAGDGGGGGGGGGAGFVHATGITGAAIAPPSTALP